MSDWDNDRVPPELKGKTQEELVQVILDLRAYGQRQAEEVQQLRHAGIAGRDLLREAAALIRLIARSQPNDVDIVLARIDRQVGRPR